MYKIVCRCDGVYTGVRIAYLKKEDKEAVFRTWEEAQKALPESRTLPSGTRLDYRIVELPR